MSGIAGFLNFTNDARDQQNIGVRMAHCLTPRGPDAEGIYTDETAVLVHRRLIVVDPEGGTQPMHSPDGNLILIYNGELYNSEDIQSELYKLEHQFKGHSDTEVLLHAFQQWGAQGCLERLNGIFAFAVWDKEKKQLTLARDRIGVKPLFYKQTQTGIVFGSELKALLCHPDVHARITTDGLRSLLLLGPAKTPGDGIFENVHEMLPGHYIICTEQDTKQQPYWELEAMSHPDNEEQTIEHTRWLLEDAAKRQLVSDVPLCTFLSGGLGSSILSMLAAKEYQKQEHPPLHTWSVDYSDNDPYLTDSLFESHVNRHEIELVSNAIGSQHHTVTLDNAALCASLLAATDARDLPGMADIDSSLLLFCSRVKKDFTVVQSGECANELFGDCPWYQQEDLLFQDTFPWSCSTDLRLSLLQDRVVTDAPAYIRSRYLAACQEADKLDGETAKDARMREMFLLNLRWFMATLLEGNVSKRYYC